MKMYTEADLKYAWEEGFNQGNTEKTDWDKSISWSESKTSKICENPHDSGHNLEGEWTLIIDKRGV